MRTFQTIGLKSCQITQNLAMRTQSALRTSDMPRLECWAWTTQRRCATRSYVDNIGGKLVTDQTANRRLRILAVEDERINLLMISRFLTGKGHDVECVVNGEEAVAACAAGQYDCVIMDMQMPRMDGLTATTHILQQAARDGRRPPPIIALSAHTFAADRQAFLSAGMTASLAKPVDLMELLDTIYQAAGCK